MFNVQSSHILLCRMDNMDIHGVFLCFSKACSPWILEFRLAYKTLDVI
jgi:hypothetical protein